MKQLFKDAYGSTASIEEVGLGFKVVAENANGKKFINQIFPKPKYAMAALNNTSDSWKEIKGGKNGR